MRHCAALVNRIIHDLHEFKYGASKGSLNVEVLDAFLKADTSSTCLPEKRDGLNDIREN